jgi:rhodanese-related sulfurtransferase
MLIEQGGYMNYRMILVVAMLVVITGCSSNESEISYIKISGEEAKAMMSEEALIVDVREPDEYAEGHIENAILIPLGDINTEKLSSLPDKDQVLLVYCRSGNRSGQAAKKLIELGYTKVYDFGGIVDWPYEIVK